MKLSVIHEVICDKAERDVASGKLNCTGITERLFAEQFPYTIGFSLVVWLKGVTEAKNQFKITLLSPTGKILGESNGYKVMIHDSNNPESIAEMIFHFNNVTFQSAQEYYTIEVRHQDKLLLSKAVGAAEKPRLIPITPFGDRGYVRL
jgi:hypothetical protein